MTKSAFEHESARRALLAGLIGAVSACALIAVWSHLSVDRMTFGDGVLHRYVAEHLASSPAQISHDIGGHGTALRYGRIVFPALLWLLSLGRSAAMPYVQPGIMVLSAAAIAGASARLLPRFDGGPAGLVPFVSVGLIAGLVGGFAEPLAVAFGVWAVVFARDERWLWSSVLLCLAILTRENAAAVLAGLVVWLALRRDWRPASILLSSLIPVAAWYVVVRIRFGFLPQDDPFLRNTYQAFGPPLIAIWRSVAHSPARATIVVLIHVVIAALALFLWRSSDLGAVAAGAAVLMTWNGPPQWRYVGDAVRLQVFLEVFFILALVSRLGERGGATDEEQGSARAKTTTR